MNVYESITKGLEEAVQYEKGELREVKTDRVCIAEIPQFEASQIKTIRMNYNLTQTAFSNVLGVSKKTVEAWESGRNKPSGPAQRMLGAMVKDNQFLEKYSILSNR